MWALYKAHSSLAAARDNPRPRAPIVLQEAACRVATVTKAADSVESRSNFKQASGPQLALRPGKEPKA